MTTDSLQNLARTVDRLIPDAHGFVILVMPFLSEEDAKKQGPLNFCQHVSNVRREDMYQMMKDFVEKVKDDPTYNKDA